MKVIIVLLVIILFFAGCAEEVEEVTPPDTVVNKYWALVQAENLDQAQKLVVEGREDIIGALDFALDEELGQVEELKEILKERISIIADGYDQDNNIALVNVTVTKPDLKQTFGTFIMEAFPEIMAMAFEGASEQEIEQKAAQLLLAALNEAEDIVHQEKAELRFVDGEWKIYDWHFDNIERRLAEIGEGLEGLD